MPLLNIGVAGVFLAWLMFRVEKQIGDMRASTDANTQAVLLLTLALPDADDRIKAEADKQLRQLEVRNVKRAAT